jgi:hypothetical protein
MTRDRVRRLIELRDQRRSMIVDRIARDFVKLLRESLSRGQWIAMTHRNVANIGTGICASHDFCDANMPMADAFERHMGHTPEADSERDASFWNDAWQIAQRRDLTAYEDEHPDRTPRSSEEWRAIAATERVNRSKS